MNIMLVMDCFASLLEERLGKSIFTTEDSVRYTFFHALTLNWAISPQQVILEYPHPTIPGAEIDLIVETDDYQYVFEFKFDRSIPSRKNLPRSQKAGAVFADISRLARFQSMRQCEKYFLYVTNGEMAGYFQNPRNSATELFQLPEQSEIAMGPNYFSGACNTLKMGAGQEFPCCTLSMQYKKNLDCDYYIRLFKIQ